MKQRGLAYFMITTLTGLSLLGSQAWAFGPQDHDEGGRQAREDSGKSSKKGFKSAQVKEREPVRKRSKKGKRDDSVLREDALRHARQKLKGNDLKFERSREQSDRLGFKHIHLRQSYKDIPIIGAEYIVHIDADDNIYASSENFVPQLSLDITPAFDADKALEIISGDFQEDIAGKLSQPPVLVIYGGELAYSCVFADASVPYEMHYFISAQSGAVLRKYNNIQYARPTQANGESAVNTISGNRLSNEDGALTVLGNGWHGATEAKYYLYSFDNLWGLYDTDTADWSQNSSPSWGTADPTAISAAVNFEITQAYVNSVLGINSFNDQGAFAQGNIHYSTNYANAFWNGTDFTFGDGDGYQYKPLTTLDIIAHEYGHAITQYTSNLTYSYESGALNESFSDIFSAMVEFSAQPDGRGAYPNSTAGAADWLEGEDAAINSAFRDFRDPQRFVQPSYYQGNMWYVGSGDNGGVHYNSGVQNHVFYLLSEGGSGSNDGHAYGPIPALGIAAAGEIAMYANMNLLTPSASYFDARDAWILAAQTLGYTAAQVQAVSDAWLACGVSPVRLTAPSPVPNATMGQPYTLQMTVSGAVGNYTCSLVDGDVLPAGLTLDSGLCKISGVTQSQPIGSYLFGVEAVDSIGMPASRLVSINVVSPVTLTPPNPVPVAYMGQAYSAQMNVTGAVGAYACTLRSGTTLPTGLSLDSATCRISGVTAIQSLGNRYPMIDVVDSLGMPGSASFAINVASAITLSLPTPVAIPVVNNPFNLQFVVTGAAGAYSCSASNLPSGLSLNSSACKISGSPTTVGTSQFVVNLVDSLGMPGKLTVTLEIFDDSQLVEALTAATGSTGTVVDVATDSLGNFYVAYYNKIDKYDSQLNLIDTLPYETGLSIYDLAVAPSGNVAVTGSVSEGFRTRLYDSNLNEIWVRDYTAAGYSSGSKIMVDSAGVIYVAGKTSLNSQYNYVVFKYNELGEVTPLAVTPANSFYDKVGAITVDLDGNIYLAGNYWWSYTTYGIVHKFSPSGVEQWAKTVWNYYYQTISGMTTDPEGNLYVGYDGYQSSKYVSRFIKVAPDSTTRWDKVISFSDGSIESRGLTLTENGVLTGLGYLYGRGGTSPDIVTLVNKDLSQGVRWGLKLFDSGTSDIPAAMAAGPDGGIFVAGRNTAGGFLIRYDSTDHDLDNDGYDDLAFGGTDCNDTDPLVHPGANETCDAVDNNCNGQVDEGVTTSYYRDTDQDGYGDALNPTQACSAPSGYVSDATDCNDNAATTHPGANETCDTADNNCNGQVDEGVTTSYYRDTDQDGYGDALNPTQACSAPSGYVSDATDCNDNAATTNPGANETCDAVDNNCNGQVDEGVTTTYYRDTDQDGYGDALNPTQACSAPSGYVSDATDCNDGAATTNPAANETCDAVDNNCNDQVDEGVTTTYYRDTDQDGYGDALNPTQACSAPSGYVSDATDCNDGAATTNPAANETCDAVDNNCNGQVDEGVTTTYYRDTDQDGYGDALNPTQACSAPSGYVNDATDCNDNAASVHPGANETCDTVDNNCNGQVDEGVTTTYYRDNDHDGYGVNNQATAACSLPSGYSLTGNDCSDLSASIHPGASEVIKDGIDQDCNGYDLTIAITKSEYDEGDEELVIYATSRRGQNANLVVQGYGAMTWRSSYSRWEMTIDHLDEDEVPATITVSGAEGSVTHAVSTH